jgi:hypothetical protein
VQEIQDGRYDAEMVELKSLDVEALKKRYQARDIEPK